LAREPKRRSLPRKVPGRGVIYRRAVVPVVPASSSAPIVVAPSASPAASVLVLVQVQSRAPRRGGGGQFSYLGG
jgi:hypothetical protein